jgi:hypothetical protein
MSAPVDVLVTGAARHQAEREAADLANHKERIVWLTSPLPTWSCGELVDAHTRNAMLLQSRAALARVQGEGA